MEAPNLDVLPQDLIGGKALVHRFVAQVPIFIGQRREDIINIEMWLGANSGFAYKEIWTIQGNGGGVLRITIRIPELTNQAEIDDLEIRRHAGVIDIGKMGFNQITSREAILDYLKANFFSKQDIETVIGTI